MRKLITYQEHCTGEDFYPETVVDHFKPMYMEAIDGIINSIKDRFKQPGIKVFDQVEQLFVKLIRKDSVVNEFDTLQANFKGDYDRNSLMAEFCDESNQSTLEMSSKSFNLCPMKTLIN